MSDTRADDLLARLAGKAETADGSDPWSAIKSTVPQHEPSVPARASAAAVAAVEEPAKESANIESHLDNLCQRLSNLVGDKSAAKKNAEETPRGESTFVPIEPTTYEEARLTDSEVEALILKYLLNRGTACGREIADQVKLPFKMIEELLRQMKSDQLVIYKGANSVNDYQYVITDMGRERGRRHYDHCTYFGAAPVALSEYISSIKAQSIEHQKPTVDDLRRAFSDLLLSQKMLNRLGPAVNSGRGLFLYGAPGNGKTSIAERVTKAFGQTIWIPRALGIEGEIIRLFDPSNHEEMPLEAHEGLFDPRRIDKRWIRIRRPTIVVGGELTMDNLEITLNPATKISEAPLQMKSNCGTLVIDDFGRQRMSTDELLNRWIVPLEKRYDFLNMASGHKIQVPFDQLIIFSTNLQPKDLVDDAFLRRIPYKIDVCDPTEEEFRNLFQLMAPKMGFVYHDEPINYLISKHYLERNRPMRCCHPRDLLQQVRNFCFYQAQPAEITKENLDFAVENYFAVM